MDIFHFLLFLILGLASEAAGLAIVRDIASSAESWRSLGCYVDNVSGRALPKGESIPGGSDAMTNYLCVATCSDKGFTLAGTEYAGECCKSFSFS